MKKIGIITYHNAINYGAVLQAYALSKYLNENCCKAEIINYCSPAIEVQYRLKKPSESFSIKNFFAHNLICLLHIEKKNKFKAFLKELPLSKEYTRETLNTAEYDMYITGSDQVFNPDCNRSDPSFFLDFVSSHKYSYAASMGSIEQFKSSRLDTKKLLSRFSSISMRENDAAKYLSEELGRHCYTVVDPVWLLPKENWLNIADRATMDNYILVYNLMDYSYMRDYAVNLSKKTGLPLIVINRTIIGEALYFGKGINKSNSSPSEFIGLINNASFFVTDSFHGTSFAIILEKEFAVALSQEKISTNSRLHCLLGNAGLTNRLISDHNDPYGNTIDYKDVKSKMTLLINDSKLYLQYICEEALGLR